MHTKREKGFYEKYIKVPQDTLIALIALIVLSPVLLLVALLVRIKLGAPVIFKQERAGKNGEPFYMYKFRSMSDARDAEGNLLPDELNRKLSSKEYDEVVDYAIEIGVENAYIQEEGTVSESFIPEFDNEGV